MSETERYLSLTTHYCRGNGIDIGSGGKPVLSTAIQIELSVETYAWYNSSNIPMFSPQWRGDNACSNLPFKDGVLDYVYSSHLIEDFLDWIPLIKEWWRVIKPLGFLVVLLPDKKLWGEAMLRGQPPNCQHRHEGRVGELTEIFKGYSNAVVKEDRLTDLFPNDYSILFVAQKIKRVI